MELEYETLGDRAAEPLLLVAGLSQQLIGWDDDFCSQLADRGFHVIRFDNRDCGLSTWMEEAGPADIAAAYSGNAKPAYQLDDLADDAVGLLDDLGIGAAHVVGASMGGFIAQLVALNHHDRVLSLTSIMSGPGRHDEDAPKPDGAAVLMTRPPATREERIEQAMSLHHALLGSRDPFDEAYERARATRAVDRVPGGGRTAARRDSGGEEPPRALEGPPCADAGHSRNRRRAGAGRERPPGGRCCAGRAAGRVRGNGPQPAAASVA